MENRLKMTHIMTVMLCTHGEKNGSELNFFLTVILFLLKDCMHNRDCEWLSVLAKLAMVKNKDYPFGADYQSDRLIVHVSSSEYEGNLELQGYTRVAWFLLIFETRQCLKHGKKKHEK